LQIQFRKSNAMAEHSLWRFSRALHSAINEHQPEDLETLIVDDVDWVIFGPIELFPFLGARRGKAAVLKVPADLRKRAGAPLPSRVNHAGRGYGRIDDALFANGTGLEQADRPAARSFRAI
jgi:hypothetical protein